MRFVVLIPTAKKEDEPPGLEDAKFLIQTPRSNKPSSKTRPEGQRVVAKELPLQVPSPALMRSASGVATGRPAVGIAGCHSARGH
jgi:hypothetical protein